MDHDETEGRKTETGLPDGGSSQRIGPYRLLQKIGEGGMGEVYLAEQTEPVRRQVALKVIKHGMDTKQVIARFESERQALALMNHPSIARVFDAGATANGRLYFAMEYIKGVPITRYCDEHRMTTDQRLTLFTQVCDGVQHAHQKGIIHRDIKPSNVLTCVQDGKPVPKIIDFGVAKATGPGLTEKTMFTEVGALVGTPEYMSPEQTDTAGLDIDTRTDVYSLGVLLYELLVGARPFDSKGLRQASFDEMRRKIREDDPARPSTRLGTLGKRSEESARRRGTELPSLRRQLKGDLDWIVMKALEKDRTRRYGSPSELAQDLRRHLEHQPVVAGPPSATYRARKFVRRHRVGVAASLAAAVVLLVFAVTMTVQAGRIARERDRANREGEAKGRVSRFLVDLFKEADPDNAKGASITAKELLGIGAERIELTLGDQPRIQAELMDAVGEVYMSLGLFDEAEPLVAGSLETRRRVLGPEHPDTLRTLRRSADLYWYLGRYDEADAAFVGAMEAQLQVLGEEHPDTLHSMFDVAWRHMEKKEFEPSEALFRRTLEIQRRVLGREHNDTLRTLNGLANLLKDTEEYEAAERVFLEAIEIRERVMGVEHSDTLSLRNNLATLLVKQERFDEAEALVLENLEVQRRVLGDDHADTIASVHNLAVVHMSQGRLAEAKPLIEHAIANGEQRLGPDHPDQAIPIHTLGQLLLQQGDLDGAGRELQRAHAIYARHDHANLGEALFDLGRISALRGESERALEFLGAAVETGWVKGPMLESKELSDLRRNPGFAALASAVEASERGGAGRRSD